ncbi:50S ribosomal protein L35ae [Candidatus Woesearchaeota archaeon]|nr:50S ribosomal protein L35ae [Candidatus Woesearchaeota archaeon]
MDAQIVSFRRGRHTQRDNQMIVASKDSKNKSDAEKLVGKKVVYTTSSGKEIAGEIASSHGNKGALRVVFETGMPGQSVGEKVKIN